jgi:hypothetical protein
MEPTKDACGISLCTGSGYLIRRSAFEAVGGWPTGTLADDTVLSLRLLGAGWETAFVHETLQHGTVPTNFAGHIKKHTQRTIGILQTTWNHKFFLFGPTVRKLTILQRLTGFIFGIDAFSKTLFLVALIIIPSVLIIGGVLVACVTADQLRWLIRLCFIHVFLSRLQEWIASLPFGYRLGQKERRAALWLAPYDTIALIKFLLPMHLSKVSVSPPRTKSTASDSSYHLSHRLKNIVFTEKGYIHLLYLLYLFLAVEASLTRVFEAGSTTQGLIYLVTHIFFPPLLWFVIAMAFMVPLRYAIWPPLARSKADFVEGEGESCAGNGNKEEIGARTWMGELGYSIGFIFAIVMFCGSFVF